MPTFPELLMMGADEAASGPFTWSDIASQVARWDMLISGSVSHDTGGATGVVSVADQVASYDLDVITDTETGPTYSSSDATFGGAGSATHTSGTDDLVATSISQSQPFTVWGVAALAASVSSRIFDGGTVPFLDATEAHNLSLSAYYAWTLGDSTHTDRGLDNFIFGGTPFLFIAYYDGASSYLKINGRTVTLDGATVTAALSSFAVRDQGHKWSILGVVDGEIASGTQDDMLALAVSERGVSADWTPKYLAPAQYLRGDLGHSFSDTDPVSGWTNQGTESDGTVTQGTGSRQPTYDASHASFNSQAVIDFDGGDVLVSTASSWWHCPDGTDITLIVVFRPTVLSATDYIVRTLNNTAQGGIALRPYQYNFDLYEQGGTLVGHASDTGSLSTDTVYVLCGTFDDSAETMDLLTDGVSCDTPGTSLGTTGDIAAASVQAMALGAGTSSAGNPFTGQLAEVIFCKRSLTAAEEAALVSYLNTRYGLSLTAVTQ